MKSNEIFDLIEQIAATSSKNEKQELIAQNKGDADFVRVLVAALNPLISYGIANVPTKEVGGGLRQMNETTWQVLTDLASRGLTGNAARDAIQAEMDMLDEGSAELLKRIIKKDLRAGFGESTVNKVIKGLIPDFPYMRCSLPKDGKLDEWDWPAGAISQEKADGMFANLNHEESGNVQITSRQGTPFPIDKFALIVADVKARITPGTQLHGEILVLIDGQVAAREIGNGILNSVTNGGDFEVGQVPIYKVWDQIPLTAVVPKGKYEIGYGKRLSALYKQLPPKSSYSVSVIETRLVTSLSEAYDHYRELLKRGKEGTILKKRTAIWRDGTSKEQIKFKLEAVIDLKVVKVLPGKIGSKNEGRAGSLTCVSACEELSVDVAVKNEAMRDAIDANPDDWIERIMPICGNGITEPSDSNPLNSIYLPRFAEANYRLDKTEADSLVRVREQFEAAVSAV